MTVQHLNTGTEQLQCSLSGHVATLTLNNPRKRNALGSEMTTALTEMLTQLDINPDVRVLVVTGAGDAFCSGGDVSDMGDALAGGGEPDAHLMIRNLRTIQNNTVLQLYNFSKPTIATLPGPAAGAGMSLALACDLRVCAASGYLLPAFGGIGLSGDFGGSWLLNHAIGPAHAKEIYFRNKPIRPENGLALGVFNAVVTDAELAETTRTLANEIAQFAPKALIYMKENQNRARTADFRTCLDMEADNMIRTLLSEDHKEGAQAFLEKRAPIFRGR